MHLLEFVFPVQPALSNLECYWYLCCCDSSSWANFPVAFDANIRCYQNTYWAVYFALKFGKLKLLLGAIHIACVAYKLQVNC